MANFEKYFELNGIEVFNIFLSKYNKTSSQLEKSNCLEILCAIQTKFQQLKEVLMYYPCQKEDYKRRM